MSGALGRQERESNIGVALGGAGPETQNGPLLCQERAALLLPSATAKRGKPGCL